MNRSIMFAAVLACYLLGIGNSFPAHALPATCMPMPYPTTPAGTVFTLPIFFGSGQGKIEQWSQACQDGSGKTAVFVLATPLTASVHVCSPTILQNGIQFQGRLAPGPGQSFCDSLFIPQTFILVEFSGTPQFNGAAAFSLINDGIPATRIDVPAAGVLPPPPTVTVVSTGCMSCGPGQVVTTHVHIVNPGPAILVELKTGVRFPDGSVINLLGRHNDMALGAGQVIDVDLLSGFVVPLGTPPGTYLFEAALLEPELGVTLSRHSIPLQSLP